jgi:hypothetical protein
MKVVLLIVVCVIVVVTVIAGVVAFMGSRLPKAHTATRSILLHQSPQNVYAVVRDFNSAPQWRTDVKRIVVENHPNGPVHFREEGHNGAVNYELAEDLPGQRMVTQILDTDLGYSGKWTYVFTPEQGGTRLSITEDGEVSNVVFRFMSRYVFGHTSTLDGYLTALAKKFGETGVPQ